MYVNLQQKKKNNLKLKCEGLHPDLLSTVIKYIEKGYVSLKDGEFLIWYKKLDNNIMYKEAAREIIEDVYDREKVASKAEFEAECGYTIEQLEKLGFEDSEIEKMQSKFDGNTGEKIDRKEVVYNYIRKKNEERQAFEKECGYTFKEIGKGVLEDFKKDPKRAEKAIKDLEHGIKVSKRANDEIIQGED